MAAYARVRDFSPVQSHGIVNSNTGDGARVAAYDTTPGRGFGNKAIKFNGLTNNMSGAAFTYTLGFGGNVHFPMRQFTGQFTLEFFVYWADATPLDQIYGSSGQFTITRTSTTNLRLTTFNGTTINGTIALSTLHHVAVTRNGANLITFWIDGVSIGTTTDATAWNTAILDHYWGSANSAGSISTSPMYLSGIRITAGVCRYTAGFTPPTSPYPTTVGGDASWANVVVLSTGEEDAVTTVNETENITYPSLIAIVTGLKTMLDENVPPMIDVYDGGVYEFVVGADLTVLNTPANTPFYGRVDLMVQKSRRVIRSTWSDPVTGAYAFRYIKYDPVAQEPKYTLMGWDHTVAQRRAVIADGQIPDLMTSFPS